MSLAGSARAAPCRDVDGIASSRMLPLSVVNCNGKGDIKLLKPLLETGVSIRDCVI